ncbi:uncharacterized protein LOC105430573 [Pogonomyrmex barbatus]|uniref:Uncharacterized protein LOC105430573 n=1 Tax=Pogonomyrmex barbatus TaxID=144034 RepID=A0A6I9WIE9_9HYME|nr:uncharacterized protein LOC105430573 [Pogonomyrmex barbatus]
MSEIKDDPREVLVLLNSLGFVGITATQLKAFMKDLKIYRKIKERERQQRKEEIKTKIINKQQALFKETHNIEYSSNNIVASESSNSLDDESVVKVRVRCLPKKDIQNRKHFITAPTKSDEKSKIEYDKEDFVQIAEYDSTCEQNYFNTKYSIRDSKHGKQNISKCLVKNSHLDERCKQNLKIEQMKPMTLIHEHTSAPVLSNHESKLGSRSVISDVTGNIRVRSALSARSSINSGHKSCKLCVYVFV